MRDSNLLRLLKPQVARPVGLVNRLTVARGPEVLRQRLAALRAQGIAHVIVDAVADADLHVIADACQDMPFLTGGSAVAMPLPAIWARRGLVTVAADDQAQRIEGGSAIVLSGSCSAMTNAQVDAFIENGHPAFRLDPLDLATGGTEAALDWLASQSPDQTPIIYATARAESVRAAQEKLGREGAGRIVEDALAACATAARDRGARKFVIAGGETSGAVGRALGLTSLDVGAEIAPGVPWCFSKSSGHAIAIALKSGNFGAETFFEDALGMLVE